MLQTQKNKTKQNKNNIAFRQSEGILLQKNSFWISLYTVVK